MADPESWSAGIATPAIPVNLIYPKGEPEAEQCPRKATLPAVPRKGDRVTWGGTEWKVRDVTFYLADTPQPLTIVLDKN